MIIQPAQTYYVRAFAHNAMGASQPSDPATQFTSAPIPPGRCVAPKLAAKAKCHTATIKWLAPEFNGGSDVCDYELRLIDCGKVKNGSNSNSEDNSPGGGCCGDVDDDNSQSAETNNNNNTEGIVVYKGADTQANLTCLAPGRVYRAQVRAANKVGWGEWSLDCEFLSGAGCPDPPQAPHVTSRASNSIQVRFIFLFFFVIL